MSLPLPRRPQTAKLNPIFEGELPSDTELLRESQAIITGLLWRGEDPIHDANTDRNARELGRKLTARLG